jgi:uncharacterized damage-inducible protein DinB
MPGSLTSASQARHSGGAFSCAVLRSGDSAVETSKLILAILDEGYEKRTWHGPNLKQSLRGVTAKEAAWRPGAGRHNIWEVTLHAAYWKYALRRRIEGGRRGSFALKGSNFFARPERGKENETAWSADKELLERAHGALRESAALVLQTPRGGKLLPQLWGIAMHDIYHAGQIRLLRRLMGRDG